MTLTLYNTLTRTKAPFQPIDPANVRMYVCGPTVYDFAHIGNARPVIVFDVLFRLLRHVYGAQHVTYVRNITDVDDKINARAAERYADLAPEVGIRKLTEETAAQFHKDIAALGVLPPTHEPRATENIQQMIDIIVALLAKGHAYIAAGEVLFDVRSMKDYGELSNRNLDDQQAGARVEVEAHKKNPGDFVLWKLSEPQEPGWESPWGRGRPGWHIECSAMSARYLGDVFDIHGGGLDLIFPHHENEIAQSRCAHGTPVMAKTWMHNGFLQVEGEKMSKSLGNFITINELLGQYHGGALRLNMLRTHYRQPIDWQKKEIERTRHELWKWADWILSHAVESHYTDWHHDLVDKHVIALLEDDLNTPGVVTRLHELSAEGRSDQRVAATFAATLGFLGIGGLTEPRNFTDTFVSFVPDEKSNLYSSVYADLIKFKNYSANGQAQAASYWEQSARSVGVIPSFAKGHLEISFEGLGEDETNEERIRRLLSERAAARKAKDFKESDRIRDELARMGIALKDTKNKETGEIETTWELAR